MTSLALESTAIASTVERAIEGDELAFARIVGAYHLDLVRVAYVICGDEALAEEATQASWWVAWRKMRSLREPDRIKGWLVAVAANEARKLVRREHRHRIVELRVDHAPPAGVDDAGEIDHVDLANALSRLTPDERALVALRYAAELDSSELGSLLGLSPSGVRSRLSRLLDRLRRELGHD
jgi:RNA polymerase sigma-70 factor (ECF subfamily)